MVDYREEIKRILKRLKEIRARLIEIKDSREIDKLKLRLKQ